MPSLVQMLADGHRKFVLDLKSHGTEVIIKPVNGGSVELLIYKSPFEVVLVLDEEEASDLAAAIVASCAFNKLAAQGRRNDEA